MKNSLLMGMLLPVAFLFSAKLKAQPHNCTNQFFVSLYENTNPNITTFYTVEAATTQVNFNNAFTANAWINSIGFNRLDNYIYAIRRNTGDIIRVAANGAVTTVGTEPTVLSDGGWITGAGDVAPDGRYVVNQRPRNSLFVYRVTPTFEALGEVSLVWHPSSGNTGPLVLGLDDLVFDPCDANTAYTFQRGYNASGSSEPVATRNHLLRIDMDSGSSTYGNTFVVGEVNPAVIRHLGAMFFNAQGELFAYGALNVSSASFVQDRMVKINPENGDVILVGTGPGASGNDGCSCPYSLVMAKQIEDVEYNCGSTRITYAFTVINKTYEDISDVRFRDELPLGSNIEAISPANPFGVAPVSGTGVGTREVIYNNLTIAEGDTVNFQLIINTTNSGAFANQAVLDNLPALLGNQILSDDPATDTPNDSTIIMLEPTQDGTLLEEDNVLLCPGESVFFDGAAITSAGVFEYLAIGSGPGVCDTLYRLTVESREEVLLTINNTLCPGELYTWQDTLLGSGSYQFVLPATTGNCDTTVMLELPVVAPPVGNLRVTLCEGQSTQINGTTFREPGEFELILPGASVLGCDSTLLITVQPPSQIYVPSAFSPLNRDGVNDEVVLYTGNSGGRIDRFDVFSRWGEHLYRLENVEINGSQAAWDGRFRGRPAGPGVYVYVLAYTCDSGEEVVLKGNIHLIN